MTDQLISFETAKLAKEKGFEQNPYKIADAYGPRYKDGSHIEIRHSLFNPDSNICTAPTQSLLQKWLREKYNIHIVIKPFFDSKLNKITYAADIMQIGNYIAKNKRLVVQDTYELALDIAEQESLKFIP